jgi:hypothetical protein
LLANVSNARIRTNRLKRRFSLFNLIGKKMSSSLVKKLVGETQKPSRVKLQFCTDNLKLICATVLILFCSGQLQAPQIRAGEHQSRPVFKRESSTPHQQFLNNDLSGRMHLELLKFADLFTFRSGCEDALIFHMP